ncbi:hypothetical protein PR202_ga01855 [Eleusine coracana subsp. coracana]|uniref:Uncharacterized protein n=1 Tax=Eleusine coracana subsp. coracana TaxID=191504 RepID=A0AAV5BKP7_ELECO|nr:hypothetical protein PR202_ga01168 [Eleusine coracana subsp. coracana]GJM86037.1 hypothetical protein PR202_ga01855 [Eleusine coracana subsp. coracana]
MRHLSLNTRSRSSSSSTTSSTMDLLSNYGSYGRCHLGERCQEEGSGGGGTVTASNRSCAGGAATQEHPDASNRSCGAMADELVSLPPPMGPAWHSCSSDSDDGQSLFNEGHDDLLPYLLFPSREGRNA